jgi:protein-arginine kinase
MNLGFDSALLRLPDVYPLQSLIRKALDHMATVTAATYSDITTSSGNVIRVVNEMSLGDILSIISTLLFMVVVILFFFMHKIWKSA